MIYVIIKRSLCAYENAYMEHRFKEQLKNSRIESPALDDYWRAFTAPKDLTMANFKEGVERFIQIANMRPEERLSFYGNRFAGLYSNIHLAELWNEACLPDETIVAHDLDNIKPRSWKLAGKDTVVALKYLGRDPAHALKQLLTGPSVIDCGMFCQLGIWFGILYLLGHTQFNENFASEPLLITRFLYTEAQEDEEYLGNPLFEFFTELELDSVAIEHVFNDPLYKFKHPGGNSQGENCLVLNTDYYQFEPLTYQGKLSRAAITSNLLATFNQQSNTNDANAMTLYSENRDFFESMYGCVFQTQFSSVVLYKLFLYNPILLQEAADAVFGKHETMPKQMFLASVVEDISEEQQDSLESLFATPHARMVFHTLITSKPGVYAAFYRGIFNEFSKLHQSLNEETLTSEEFEDRQSQIDHPIPSFLYFNLDSFLLSLKQERLHTSTSELQSNKRRKSEADNATVSSVMGIFSGSELPLPATEPSPPAGDLESVLRV